MSFQGYLDNIKAKTGKTADDFKNLAAKKGLLKPTIKAGEIVEWLKKDFDLGHGHAMAIYAVLKSANKPKLSSEDAIEKHFNGNKAVWRKTFDGFINKLKEFGNEIKVEPTSSYLSILNADKKFAVVQITNERMDIGIKLKGTEPTERFESSGSWNTMMTHRVRINSQKQIDKELIKWLRNAYEQSSDTNKKNKQTRIPN